MILGSGNVVHNLRRVQWDQPDAAFDWAERFDDAVVEQLASDPGDILKVAGASGLCAGGADARSFHSAALSRRPGGRGRGRRRAAGAGLCDGVDLDDLLRRRQWTAGRGETERRRRPAPRRSGRSDEHVAGEAGELR